MVQDTSVAHQSAFPFPFDNRSSSSSSNVSEVLRGELVGSSALCKKKKIKV